MTTIQIHEFSTGIAVQGTPENWCSTRFTGYMNLTLNNVPTAVQNAISHGLFKAAEGSMIKASEPAIIGREVKEGSDAWSVIAVITGAKDDKERYLHVYRYFLTQGIGNLGHLLYWYICEAKKTIFDPFDIKNVGDFYEYDTNQTMQGNPLAKQEYQDLLNSKDDIIIVPHNWACVPVIINELTSRKKGKDNLVAWAYKVEGLEKHWTFQAIYPASEKAQETIEQQIKKGDPNAPNITGKAPEKIVIQKAIRNLANQGKAASTFITDIENALKASQTYNNRVWQDDIFGILGIESVKNGSVENYSSVRLYELYGLILPQKFSNFLKWLKLDKIKKDSDFDQEHYKVASELSRNIQGQINNSPNSFKGIGYKAFQGIDYVLYSLILEEGVKGIEFDQETRKNLLINWLNLDNDGLWKTVYYEYYHQLWQDIIQISNNYITARNELIKAYSKIPSKNNLSSETDIKRILKEKIQPDLRETYESKYAYENLQILGQDHWKSITTDLIQLIWYGQLSPNKKYIYLAQFFQKMGEGYENSRNNFLSAIFYHLAIGEVPKSIWKKCKFEARYICKFKIHNIPEAPSIKLTRQLEWWEPILAFSIKILSLQYKFWTEPYEPKEVIKSTSKAVLLRYLILTFLTFIFTVIIFDNLKSRTFLMSVINENVQSNQQQKVNKINLSLDWQETVKAFDTMRDDFVAKGITKNKAEEAITNNLAKGYAYQYMPDNGQAWVEKIKKFQEENLIESSGYMKKNDRTYNLLQCKVVEELALFDEFPMCGN